MQHPLCTKSLVKISIFDKKKFHMVPIWSKKNKSNIHENKVTVAVNY